MMHHHVIILSDICFVFEGCHSSEYIIPHENNGRSVHGTERDGNLIPSTA